MKIEEMNMNKDWMDWILKGKGVDDCKSPGEWGVCGIYETQEEIANERWKAWKAMQTKGKED